VRRLITTFSLTSLNILTTFYWERPSERVLMRCDVLGGTDKVMFWNVNCFRVGSDSGVYEHPTGTVCVCWWNVNIAYFRFSVLCCWICSSSVKLCAVFDRKLPNFRRVLVSLFSGSSRRKEVMSEEDPTVCTGFAPVACQLIALATRCRSFKQLDRCLCCCCCLLGWSSCVWGRQRC
jgi:hypothetical protein